MYCFAESEDTIHPGSESSSMGFFKESTYIIIIVILFGVSVVFSLYYGLQCCRNRQQLKLNSSLKSCQNPAYHGYAHPPPHYTTSDKSKVDHFEYTYVPINEMLKSPSIENTEKRVLTPQV